MQTVHQWLEEYGESHHNATNKALHWVCVPAIMFSLLGLIWSLPTPSFFAAVPLLNWATLLMALALLYYLRLSLTLALGMLLVSAGLLTGLKALAQSGVTLWLVSLIVFVVAWIGQFIGHKIEGKKPSFFKDLQFLLIGPLWLLSFVYRRLGIKY